MQCVDKLEQAMQSADFWVELADTSFGKVVLHGKNADRDTGEYYEVSSEINTDGDFAITFFKTYNKMASAVSFFISYYCCKQNSFMKGEHYYEKNKQ